MRELPARTIKTEERDAIIIENTFRTTENFTFTGWERAHTTRQLQVQRTRPRTSNFHPIRNTV